jgi:hypothetical protein
MAKRLWQDAGHFNHEVGSSVFDAIFSVGTAGSSSYGRRVSTREFDRLIADGENERRAFLAGHEWVQQELDELTQPSR